jgi:hypothetical protein
VGAGNTGTTVPTEPAPWEYLLAPGMNVPDAPGSLADIT